VTLRSNSGRRAAPEARRPVYYDPGGGNVVVKGLLPDEIDAFHAEVNAIRERRLASLAKIRAASPLNEFREYRRIVKVELGGDIE
jgi:hypothetical protein